MPRGESFDRAKFVGDVAERAPNEAVRNAIFELLHFAEAHAEEVRPGSASAGSFHYAISVGNRIVTLFTCDPGGTVSVSMGNFRLRVANRTLKSFASGLAKLPGMESMARAPDRPAFLIQQTLVDPKIMDRFKRAIRRFQQQIDDQPPVR